MGARGRGAGRSALRDDAIVLPMSRNNQIRRFLTHVMGTTYRRSVGPKGQVVIPKEIRDALGLRPGSEAIFELGEQEAVIRPEVGAKECVARYCETNAPKLRRPVNVKKLIEEEVLSRFALHR